MNLRVFTDNTGQWCMGVVSPLGTPVRCVIEFSTLAHLEISAHETLIVTVQQAKSAAF
jgi:hypothetical protein